MAEGQQFTALVDFFAEETQSQYVDGLSYTAAEQPLLGIVLQWAEEGKIELGGRPATMSGGGDVV